jgi:hypothetical protein
MILLTRPVKTREEGLSAGGAEVLPKVCFGMITNVGLQLFPQPFRIANPLTACTDVQQTFEGLDVGKRLLQLPHEALALRFRPLPLRQIQDEADTNPLSGLDQDGAD